MAAETNLIANNPPDASGVSQMGSAQGANRTTIINSISSLPDSPLKDTAQPVAEVSEMGGKRSPVDVMTFGTNEINSGASTKIQVAPEIGKGSIADVFI